MDSSSLNKYEERLYSVFKTFDVDNEEALNKSAVLALCDALQLEQRGAALVDTLFERRDQRVTFAQFRSGLLAVLGDAPPPPAPVPPAPPSDDDSSGREVAPKFVFGSKKYGRRSRPPRAGAPPVPQPPPDPAPAPTSVAAAASIDLDHEARIDCERALQLCHRLRMEGIDRQIVERIFDATPGGEMTVGGFFDRLDASLTSSIHDATSGEAAGEDVAEAALPTELVVEAWERAGVQRPRRLLAELGFDGPAAAAPALERALDDEALALAESPAARALLLGAALALARLRHERARRAADAAAAERDRLRADLDEANRRARLLAQEVDENHAKLEAELTATLRRTEARHAEAARRAEAERAAERERAAAERVALDAELVRRQDAEQRLRDELHALRERAAELEARAAEGEERAAVLERERGRLAAELRAAAERAGGERGAEAAAVAALSACADELRAENARLRDRCDELCAQLETRARAAPLAAPPTHSWHEEAAALAPLVVTGPDLENESPPVSLEPAAGPLEAPPPPRGDEAALRARLAEAEARHQEEKQKLDDLVKELESSLEQMRVEYERCEEYWSGKLEEERALLAEEQRAGDERLAELVAKIGEYERQFGAPRLPAIAEAPALERQAAELEAEAARARDRAAELARAERALAARAADLARRDRDLQRRAALLQHQWRGGGAEAELRARLARAEGAVARLAARLAAADLLVKDLYVENCLLGPAPRRL